MTHVNEIIVRRSFEFSLHEHIRVNRTQYPEQYPAHRQPECSWSFGRAHDHEEIEMDHPIV